MFLGQTDQNKFEAVRQIISPSSFCRTFHSYKDVITEVGSPILSLKHSSLSLRFPALFMRVCGKAIHSRLEVSYSELSGSCAPQSLQSFGFGATSLA